MDILDCAPSHVAPVGMATSVACPLGSKLTLTPRSTSLPLHVFPTLGRGCGSFLRTVFPPKGLKSCSEGSGAQDSLLPLPIGTPGRAMPPSPAQGH